MNSLVDLVIKAPSTLTGTVTIHVATKKAPAAGDYGALSVGGTTVTLAASQSTLVPSGSFKALKLVSSAAEGGARTFQVAAQIDATP